MFGFLGRLASGAGRAAAAIPKAAVNSALRAYGGAGLGYRERAAAAGKPLDEWTLSDLRGRNAQAMSRLIEQAWNFTDVFAHSISVKVRGGPAADLRAVYYLACAAVFGRYGRAASRLKAGYWEMSAHTDVSRKEVTITVGYKCTGIGDFLRSVSSTDGFGGKGRNRTPLDVMFEGPDQVTVGAGWTGPFGTGDNTSYPLQELDIIGGRLADITDTQLGLEGAHRYVPSQILAPRDAPAPTDVTDLRLLIPTWVLTNSAVLNADPILVRSFAPQAWRFVATNPFRELPVETTGEQQLYLRRWRPLAAGGSAYIKVVRQDKGQMPVLPDDGRIITTGETRFQAVQPPRPPVDAVARGGWLDMVAQALTTPGYLPKAPPAFDEPTPNLLASPGIYVRPKGSTKAGAQVPLRLPVSIVAEMAMRTDPSEAGGLPAAVGGFAAVDPPAPPSAPNILEK